MNKSRQLLEGCEIWRKRLAGGKQFLSWEWDKVSFNPLSFSLEEWAGSLGNHNSWEGEISEDILRWGALSSVFKLPMTLNDPWTTFMYRAAKDTPTEPRFYLPPRKICNLNPMKSIALDKSQHSPEEYTKARIHHFLFTFTIPSGIIQHKKIQNNVTQIQRKDLAPKTYSKMTKMLKLPTKDLTAAITTLLSEVNAKWIWCQVEIQIFKKQ